MKIKILSSLALSAALACFCGCVGTEDGRTTAGDPISKDTITSRYERPAETVAKATRTVLEHNGKMLVDNSVNNSFEAKVNERTVWVKVTDVDGKLTEVGVQARGPWGGDVELAAELSKQIALQIEANQNQNQ